ncbi:hypothetical protein OE165_27420, partial [Escherichia coli]|uniref:hypothetical protein n=1 Tax=Escherichia coli TaxID=562 RepID=UPI0021F3A6EF
ELELAKLLNFEITHDKEYEILDYFGISDTYDTYDALVHWLDSMDTSHFLVKHKCDISSSNLVFYNVNNNDSEDEEDEHRDYWAVIVIM